MINIFIAFGLMASAITANKIILCALPPALLVAIRMLIAGIILFVYTYFHSKFRLTWQNIKNNIITLLIVTFCTTYLPSLLKAYALQNMESSKAAFFGTLDPFITAIFAYFLCSEKLTFKKLLGIVLGFTGACILLFSTSCLEDQLKSFLFISYPEIAALLAVIIGRYGWILVQKLLKNNIYSPSQINAITMLLSGILSFITAYLKGELAVGSLRHATFTILHSWPLKYFLPEWQLLFFLLYTIVIGNVISYNLYAKALKQYSATFISLAGFSIPFFVLLFGWLFLREQLSISFFISCLITFIGLFIFFKDEQETRVC